MASLKQQAAKMHIPLRLLSKRAFILFLIIAIAATSLVAISYIRNKSTATQIAPLAFPGAVGFGAHTKGGRGGKVYTVSNLNSEGPGSFREAVMADGPRIVVFAVGGTIDLERKEVRINKPFLTIAGQTAPGGGITLRGGKVSIQTDEIIIRYIRFRPGPGAQSVSSKNAGSLDGLDIQSNNGSTPRNIIIDHSSISWGADETFSVAGQISNVTVQNSIISEGLHCIPPPNQHSDDEPCHSKNVFVAYGAGKITFYRNLIAHGIDRNPQFSSGEIEFTENVIYNYGIPLFVIPKNGPVVATIRNNYFIGGFNNVYKDRTNYEIVLLGHCGDRISASGEDCYASGTNLHISGNKAQTTAQAPERAAIIGLADRQKDFSRSENPHSFALPTIIPAASAKDIVLEQAGVTLPKRDAVDTRVVNDVKNGTGKVINSPDDVGGYPLLELGLAPLDRDHDGMSDTWEAAHNYSPRDAQSAGVDTYLADKASGYTENVTFVGCWILPPKEAGTLTTVTAALSDSLGNKETTQYQLSPNGEIFLQSEKIHGNRKGAPITLTLTAPGYLPYTYSVTPSNSTTCAQPPEDQPLLPGDFNLDGTIDIYDIVTIIRAYNGENDEESALARTLFGGNIDLTSVVAVIRSKNSQPNLLVSEPGVID